MSGFNPLSGPGSQPGEDDGTELQFMELPRDMRTYSAPSLPEPEEAGSITAALALLDEVRAAAASMDITAPARAFDVGDLDATCRSFIDQALGDGEVSIIGGATLQVQESVLAGIWRIHEVELTGALVRDAIAVGAFPDAIVDMARAAALDNLRPQRGPLPSSVQNAPALVTELDDRITAFTPDAPTHVINLTLLPLTDEDHAFLEERIGPGAVTILSRGYGNCRITSTATTNVWRVRYFNSREAIVLDTIEVTRVPSVACAAVEDLRDSAARLGEILEVYR